MPMIESIVLAAGQGTRMKTAVPKVFNPVAGKAMVRHAIDVVRSVAGSDHASHAVGRVICVINPKVDKDSPFFEGCDCAIQYEQKGTAHAVATGLESVSEEATHVFVTLGDVPLLRAETVQAMWEKAHKDTGLILLGFEAANPFGYGRIICGDGGVVSAIVEEKDASEEERAVRLCNSGIMLISISLLKSFLKECKNDNASQEYYLTDIVSFACHQGVAVQLEKASEYEVRGVNTLQDLAWVEHVWQERYRADLMSKGVLLRDPSSVWFSHDTIVEPGVIIERHVVFGVGVVVHAGAHIRDFCHIEGAHVGAGSVVGPFARLREGSHLVKNVKIGNFVEVKKSVLQEGVKVNHLSYIGDSDVGSFTNIGAGVITCNYDGYRKFRTKIGTGAFIGSQTSLVAPVEIGAGALIGAGCTVRKDVPEDALCVMSSEVVTKQGMAKTFREKSRLSSSKEV